jgi:hypothetical protein
MLNDMIADGDDRGVGREHATSLLPWGTDEISVAIQITFADHYGRTRFS